jgi:hypothetical protein
MNMSTRKFPQGVAIAFAVVLFTAALVVAGCTAIGNAVNPINPITPSSTAVPVSITDAPGDQVLAASLTLNSIVLTDAAGKTASILSAPITFEAAHLDAVQEPLFTPAIPEDTYTSVALTYSNAEVTYLDPTTKKPVQAAATLENTGQTVTFPTPIVVNNATTTLLVDYLVANSVTISGSTVTVTPDFHIAPIPVPPTPTTGVNGLQCGIQGKVTALGANSFTLTLPSGTPLVIDVNSSTQYQGLSGFSGLAVGALVEVDVITQTNGALLAARVEQQVPPNATAEMLVGPVTAVTGSPATSFTQVVRQKIGPTPSTTPIETDTITVNGSTAFLFPGRFATVSATAAAPALPFAADFSASTLFAGQVVSVATNGVTNNAATANSVALAPQTVDGTITGIYPPVNNVVPNWAKTVIALPSGSWLATVTGQSSVTVYTPIGCPTAAGCYLQQINSTPPAVGNTIRFNGFLFKNSGSLVMVALVQADGPGTPIGPNP